MVRFSTTRVRLIATGPSGFPISTSAPAVARADYLLDFLRHNDSEYLYLVGDIIDGWQLKKGWFWPQAHNDVVQKVLRKARKGVRSSISPVITTSPLASSAIYAFGDIHIREEAFHTTLAGKRLWVVHGDLFDGVIQHAKWLAYVGDSLYSLILVLNRWFNRIRIRFGFQYWVAVAIPETPGQERRQFHLPVRARHDR